ncbi:Clp protease N-terminal domain-containing protein [Actinophytocola oryzae]|uniref:ClpA/ClpB-like protein n=1 Tax=Actinophytocola oryzae TaxID=502181 RepID=A0A4R7VXV3_9PSEU|nr:Clp protease N-terminal domain-containing protein [Actinophytocola oryzae]TDV54884.1 ClpA/ClpB-like protein [Actinophytocola oryzae]
MSPIDRYLHAVIMRAGHEARADGCRTVEAEHLLLAVAAEPDPVVTGLLASAGLDRAGVETALAREFEHSLSVVGVSASAYELPPPSRLPVHPGMGTSARLALERGFASAPRKKDLRPARILLGILSAQAGTVPRALGIAGVDQDALLAGVRASVS